MKEAKADNPAMLALQVRFLRNAEHQADDAIHPFRRRIAGYLRSRCWFRPRPILTDFAAFTRPCVLRCAFPDPVNSAPEPSLRTVLQTVRQGLFANLDSGFMFSILSQNCGEMLKRRHARQETARVDPQCWQELRAFCVCWRGVLACGLKRTQQSCGAWWTRTPALSLIKEWIVNKEWIVPAPFPSFVPVAFLKLSAGE